MTVASLMMAIVLGAAPDVILLLLFGEANDRTMTTVMTLDRICDGLMGVPFIIAVFLRVRAEQFQRTPSLADLEHVAGAVDIGQIGRAHSELQSLMRISSAVFCLKNNTLH